LTAELPNTAMLRTAEHCTATAMFTWEWLGSLTTLSKTLTLLGVIS